jgi:hypothetical protein
LKIVYVFIFVVISVERLSEDVTELNDKMDDPLPKEPSKDGWFAGDRAAKRPGSKSRTTVHQSSDDQEEEEDIF